MKTKIILGMAAALGMMNVAYAGLIQNGSFETGLDPNGSVQSVVAGVIGLHNGNTTDLPGWTLVGGTNPMMDAQNNPFNAWTWSMGSAWTENGFTPWSGDSGSRSLNLSLQGESLYQSFSVIGGTTYTVSYWEMERKAPSTVIVSIALNQGTGAYSTGSYSVNETAWTEKTFTFTPSTDATATLTFAITDRASGSNGTYLDGVSIAGVPEPSTAVLLMVSLVGLVAHVWRKR